MNSNDIARLICIAEKVGILQISRSERKWRRRLKAKADRTISKYNSSLNEVSNSQYRHSIGNYNFPVHVIQDNQVEAFKRASRVLNVLHSYGYSTAHISLKLINEW